jgi:hypothetical protein
VRARFARHPANGSAALESTKVTHDSAITRLISRQYGLAPFPGSLNREVEEWRRFEMIARPMVAVLALALPIFAADDTGPRKNGPSPPSSGAHGVGAANAVGAIEMVDAAQKLVVVQTAGGASFDLKIGRQTRIENGKRRASLGNLAPDVNQTVTVTFTPERRGDVARWIRIGGTS